MKKLPLGKLLNLLVILVMLQVSGLSAMAAGPSPSRPAPKVPETVVPATDGVTPASSRFAPSGRQPVTEKFSAGLMDTADNVTVNVSVRGTMASLAQAAKALTEAERVNYAAKVSAFQDSLEQGIVAQGGTVIYRMRTLGSGVIASMPAKVAKTIASLPGVAFVSRLYDFEANLSETVNFIGGDTLKSFGIKGKGVKVAILDSGLDYTHLAFGGSADPLFWETAYYGTDPACTTGDEPQCANRQPVQPAYANLFGPNGLRVKGGFDWVGPAWGANNAPLMPDANPIALANTGTHGTHVADIIGGLGYAAGSYSTASGPVAYPAKGEGMAPEADLYAFTVCSAVSTSCSGVAMLEGMDDAADLDDNPATVDPADVLNMSLGSDYGQPEDDATWMANELTKYGTIVVLSAGNGGNTPYKVGSPSIASGAISVAQTAVPSAKQYRVIVNTPLPAYDLFNPQLISFSAPYYTGAITSDVLYDNTNADTRRGCTASGAKPAAWSDATRFAGKIALVNRGTCSISLKVANAQAAGASMVLVALIAAGDPVDFSYGGGLVGIPAFTITLADGNKLKSFYATPPMPAGVVTLANASTNPAVFVPLDYTIATTSSRGPRNHDNKIKPDVGAPGASVSAVAGTGSESAAFGGTSGAAPMVSGSMALLKALFKDGQNFSTPVLTVAQYKALLMNSANNQVFEGRSAANPEGVLLPIARIGAGQVDLEKALKTKILAYDVTNSNETEWTPSLSFQYGALSHPEVLNRILRIVNLNPMEKTIYIDWDYRYAAEANGGVTLVPEKTSVTLAPGAHEDVRIDMHIDPLKLTPWFDWNNWWITDRGSLGGNGTAFKQVEYSGYISLSEQIATTTKETITVPWLVIPKPAADMEFTNNEVASTIGLKNVLGITNHTDLFNLVDVNPNDYDFTVGACSSIGLADGCNQSPVDLKEVGYRMWQAGTTSYIDFAVTLWDEPYRAGIWPPEFDVYVDTVHPVAGSSPVTYAAGPDGIPDYVIYNTEAGGFGASGQEVVYVANLNTGGAAVGQTYLDSTFNSNNYILTVPAAAIGLPVIPFGTVNSGAAVMVTSKMNFQVLAFEAYMTGAMYDASPKTLSGNFNTFDIYHTVDVINDRFHIDMFDQAQTVTPGTNVDVNYTVNTSPATGWLGSSSQIGFLALYRESRHESDNIVLGTAVHGQKFFVPQAASAGGSVPANK